MSYDLPALVQQPIKQNTQTNYFILYIHTVQFFFLSKKKILLPRLTLFKDNLEKKQYALFLFWFVKFNVYIKNTKFLRERERERERNEKSNVIYMLPKEDRLVTEVNMADGTWLTTPMFQVSIPSGPDILHLHTRAGVLFLSFWSCCTDYLVSRCSFERKLRFEALWLDDLLNRDAKHSAK